MENIARRIRSSLPNGPFHVTVRGSRRARIFRTNGDAQTMLRLLDSVSGRWDRKAFCLMPNHFHLVVVASTENLAAAMKRVNGGYTQWFNRKYGLVGHVFQGRYDAKAIADERHLHEAIRYVVLNPVRAGLCGHPSEWPWCNWNEIATNPYLVELIQETLVASRGVRPPSGD